MGAVRVLHIINGMGTGGAEMDIMNWYRHIDRDKIQFDFLVRSHQNFYKNEIIKLGGRYYEVSPFPKKILKNFWETKRFFKDHKEYKMIHVHGNALIYLLPFFCAKKEKINCRIMHIHSTKASGKLAEVIHKYNKKRIRRAGTEFFACSKEAGDFAFLDKFTIIKNAIDVNLFQTIHTEKTEVRKSLGIPENAFVLGHVGRFLTVKNQKFVIDIFEKILIKKPSAKLVLVGDGPMKEELTQYAQEKNINNHMLMLGERKDVPELMQAIDMVVFPSLYEGVPLVPLEVQASGTKIICSENITELINITPYMKKMSLKCSAERWADAILEFSEQKILCDIKRSFYLAGYDLETEVKKLEDFYEKYGDVQ